VLCLSPARVAAGHEAEWVQYAIAAAEKSLDVLDALAIYKDLPDVERRFRQLKDVLALRPIYHQVEPRVRAHFFVAALALLVQRLLDRRLRAAGVDFSSIHAMEALSMVRHAAFRVDGEDKTLRRCRRIA
jgi:transposase